MCIRASDIVFLFPRVVLGLLILTIIGCGGGGGTAEVTPSQPTPAPSPVSGLDSWRVRTSGTTFALHDVTFGNGIFVAVGDSGTVLTSSDGVTWTLGNSGTGKALGRVTCGSGIFVAVGQDSTILSSTDGVLWTKRNSGIPDYHTFTAVTYGNGIFLADYDYGILTSPDGQSWTQRSFGLLTDPATSSLEISGIAYGNGMYLAIVQVWSLCRFARGCDGYAVHARTSPDGAAWGPLSSATVNPLNVHGLTYGNGIFLGFYGQSILTSPDGANWTETNWNAPVSLDGAVTYGNGTFIVPGTNGTILTSTNGVEWNVWNTGIMSSISRITYGNSTFVAVGSGGVIIQSDPVN